MTLVALIAASTLAILATVVAGLKMRDLSALRTRFAPIVAEDEEVARLKSEQARLKNDHEKELRTLSREREGLAKEVSKQKSRWAKEFSSTIDELAALTSRVEVLQDIGEMQDFGLYEPIFDFDSSDRYKEEVARIRQRQKELIKSDQAAVCDTTWSVEGSAAKGKQMTKKYLKLQLRAFNGEADSAITKARFDNVTKLEERLEKSWVAVNKLGETNQVRITRPYLDLKIKELRLAFELARKKQQEKEEQQAIRAQMREEEAARKEIEKAEKEAEKEEGRYEKALASARAELSKVSDAKQDALRKKIALLEKQFEEAHERKARAIARAQLTRSGHVYVISNIGSFGSGVFKIGLTRRLEPMDRVKELGDASVPFQFDAHAMIYSDDAPALEDALHKRFRERLVNRINTRREFFRVSLDEVEIAVREICGEKTEFVRTAIAEEFRQSEAIWKSEIAAKEARRQNQTNFEVMVAKERLETLKEGWKAEAI